MKKYVIIGNSIAAAGCIEGIRSVDKEGEIAVVSKEKYPAYCRPLISYCLEGKTNVDKMGYRSDDFYEKNGCKVYYGITAESINPKEKKVFLSDSSVLNYTELCIAAGSSPFIPPFKGIENVEKRFCFLTLDDILELEKSVNKGSKVLIIGAGLIGLKCAEGLKDRAGSITVCDLADRILSSILDDDTAPIVQEHIEGHGIKFMLKDSVDRFEKGKSIMRSGETVPFDVLVTAVGVRPNVSLAADAGCKVSRGISVDEHMRTSIDRIYAAGDCTEGNDISFGAPRVLALLPNAYMQGYTAGVNMAGGDKVFDNAIPMNSIGFFGLHIMTAGSYTGENDGGKQDIIKDESGIKKFFIKDGLLKGYILVGNVDRGGVYTTLIREKTPLDTLDFELLEKNASFMAFSEENRRKKFGGMI